MHVVNLSEVIKATNTEFMVAYTTYVCVVCVYMFTHHDHESNTFKMKNSCVYRFSVDQYITVCRILCR